MNKEEYEMPAEYQEQLKQLLKLIEKRDEYTKMLPIVTAQERSQMKQALAELNRSIDKLEQGLADQYEPYQAEQRYEQELSEVKYLHDTMSEEHFITVKHKHPLVFKAFEKYAMRGMTDEERAEQYAVIARREAEELDDILSGKTAAPEYRNRFIKFILPRDEMDELLTEMQLVAYETDDYHQTTLQAVKNADQARRKLIFALNDSLPVRRRNLEKKIVELRDSIRVTRRHLQDYFTTNQASGKFVEIENPDQPRLDELFEQLRIAHERLFIVAKHTQPDKFAEFEKIAVDAYTPQEKAQFYERIAEREKKELQPLLRSLADE